MIINKQLEEVRGNGKKIVEKVFLTFVWRGFWERSGDF